MLIADKMLLFRKSVFVGERMNIIKRMAKPKFKYDDFENALYKEICRIMLKHSGNDIYAFSVKYEPDFTPYIAVVENSKSHLEETVGNDTQNYFYYKYCEEEWEDAEIIKDLSDQLCHYYNDIKKWASDDSLLQEETIGEHRDKIIAICVNVLIKVKQSKEYAVFPNLNLNVYIREFLSNEEELLLYQKLNDREVVKEYKKYLLGNQ